MSKYIFIKINDAEYDPPYNAEQIKKNYGIELYNKLKKDEVHRWRMETGIELIHKEPSKKELERIWKNWQLMSDDMKEKSDKKSIELFGVDNKTNYKRLIKEYGINDMNRKCIICGRQTYNSSGICEKCWEHADEIDENDNLQDSKPISLKEIKKLNNELNSYEFGVPFNPNPDDIDNEEKYYKSLTPKELDKYKMGVCWDFTHYYCDWAKKNNLEYYAVLFVYQYKNDTKTHSFPIIKLDNKYYILESAWGKMKGVYEKNSLDEAINFYLDKWKKYIKETDHISIFKFDGADKKLEGLTDKEWLNYHFKNKKIK